MSKATFRLLLIHSSKYFNHIRFLHDSKSKDHGVDTIDDFTSKLMKKKIEKWESARTKKTMYPASSAVPILNDTDFLNDDIENNDAVFISIMENGDINKMKKMINKAVSLDVIPSFKVAEKIMSFCSQNKIKDIFIIEKLISKKYPDEYSKNSDFKHYIAEFYWLSGNVKKSLELFDEVFFTNNHLQKKVKYILRCLIVNIVHQSSEATLVSVIKFTKKIADTYGDYYLMAFIWQNCFLSEWFADQCTANKLMEENDKLADAIQDRLPYILNYAVKEHKPEILHRLMEVLLKFNIKQYYTKVLHTLFNYKYGCRDLRGCAEIVQWSVNLHVPLTTYQHEQFLSLLLGQKLPRKTEDEAKPTGPNFKLKF